MNLFGWLRAKLFGPRDPTKLVVVKEIERQVSKLNGATAQLTQQVRVIKTDRELSQQAFAEMLDGTLANRDKRELRK